MIKFGMPTDEQLAKINKLAKRTLSADEVFAFSGKSAGDMMIPGRYMMLSPKLLKVMMEDAKKGVSFMLNHSWNKFGGIQAVPYGKVFDGRMENSTENGETMSLFLDKYIVRDDEVIDGVSANALIKKIETGVLSDTSIGWGSDTMVCSICGMNYFGGKCPHIKGQTYEMADNTMKLCTVTAMPPSMMIPYNNNALFEESIVWDGAYPGACVTQSKHGDIIELPTGKFSIVQDKEELPENTLFYGTYHNGDIVTMVKKSDHQKLFKGGTISGDNTANISSSDILPPKTVQQLENAVKTLSTKGDEKPMNEKLLKMFEAFGITFKEGETKLEEALSQLAEKWEVAAPAIKDLKDGALAIAATPIIIPEAYMTAEQAKEKLSKELTADEVLSLAKEGQDYHKKVSDEALAMGVRAMGNDFPKETWEKTFSTMSTQAIADITKTWETQAKAGIPAGRQTDAGAGFGKGNDIPDEAFKA
jgi:hypothetical protein